MAFVSNQVNENAAAQDVAVAMRLVKQIKEHKLAEIQDDIEKFLSEYIAKSQSQTLAVEDEKELIVNINTHLTPNTSSISNGVTISTTITTNNSIDYDHEDKESENEAQNQTNSSIGFDEMNDVEFDGLLDSVEIENNLEKYETACQEAEWIPPKVILTHEPGNELDFGLFHPQAALYEAPFDPNKCIMQHKNMRAEFEKVGCQTVTITDVLVNMVDINKLREFAMESMEYDLKSIDDSKEREEESKIQKEYMKNLMKQLSRESLTQIIMMRPTVILKRDIKNTYFLADYQVSPLMNLLFMRDPLITTNKGIVITAMNSKQRYDETKLMRFVIEQLGYKILLDVNQEAEKVEAAKAAEQIYKTGKRSIKNMVAPKVEGGDFVPCGDYAMIGQGLRTNFEAIKLMMDNDVFGSQHVVVVKDEWNDQQEMHLDTYFNVAGKNICVMSEWRKNGIKNGEKYKTLVDMYSLEKNHSYKEHLKTNCQCKYKKTISNFDFYQFLTNKMQFKVVLASEQDQAKYGINFVCVGDNKIIGVRGASDKYINALRDAGVDAKWIDISAMQCAYGAIHCTTQPVVRSYN